MSIAIFETPKFVNWFWNMKIIVVNFIALIAMNHCETRYILVEVGGESNGKSSKYFIGPIIYTGKIPSRGNHIFLMPL